MTGGAVAIGVKNNGNKNGIKTAALEAVAYLTLHDGRESNLLSPITLIPCLESREDDGCAACQRVGELAVSGLIL